MLTRPNRAVKIVVRNKGPTTMTETLPLSGFRAVSIATNLPGPAATHRLAKMGLSILKIEPPSGDALAMAGGGWYDDIKDSLDCIETLNLRSEEGREALGAHLRQADLLITSHRPSALVRLGISKEWLASVNDRLCWLEIVGDVDAPEVPGHDLTYQAEVGLLHGTQMPRTLIADLAGAEDAVVQALGLLLGRERGSATRHAVVGLKQAAARFTQPLQYGLTGDQGPLSGMIPQYAIYPLKDGYIACAAIEPHFGMRFAQGVGDDPKAFFADKTMAEASALAKELDLPLHCFS